ncbi:unnamed protein product [Rhizophagus irregularis]|nr:unnamed protein product [Rhizophagus irregularis]
MMITLSLTFVSSRTDQTGSFRTAIWTSKNARGAEAGRNCLFWNEYKRYGKERSLLSELQFRNGLFFRNGSFDGFLRMQDRRERSLLQNGSFDGFLRMQDRREERSLLWNGSFDGFLRMQYRRETGRNGLFFQNGSFSGFLRMQDRREERNVSSFETEPSPGLEFVKGNWHSGFFFNNCSAFLY